MLLFDREDIYIGYSLRELSNIREILEKEYIKYKYKVVDLSGQCVGNGTSRGVFGGSGMNIDYEKQYVVSVKKNDSEKAKYLVNKILHP